MQPTYEIKNLSYNYNKETVLEINKLKIRPNSIVGLIGPNGSGKSTLLKLMAFLYKPTKGTIIFNGKPTNLINRSSKLKVTLLPQRTYLMKRTVYQNITYALKIRNINKKHYLKAAKFALEMVGLSFDFFANRSWNSLSGGEAQRVALAARLIFKPKVLLLDEPTSNLDSISSKLIKKSATIAKKEWGTTLVIASHDASWLNSICDTVKFMFKGTFINKKNYPLISRLKIEPIKY